MMEEEKKYKEVISALKSLPKMKAKGDFEKRLYRKLRNAESEKISSPAFEKLIRPKERIFNIFRPSFVPAIGLTLVLVAVIVVYFNFLQQDDKLTEQAPVTNEEMVIKDPGSIEKSGTLSDRENGELITHDVTGYRPDERSPLPVSPTSDVESEPAPTLSEPKKVDEIPVMEQTIEEREEDEKVLEKEGFIQRKSDDLKKIEKKETIRSKKSDEETNLKKNIGDETNKTGVQPSMGLDKSKSKDSLKTDSVESQKNKIEGNENGQIEQKTETEKQAEPKPIEPDKIDK